jgi:hypothetical protein
MFTSATGLAGYRHATLSHTKRPFGAHVHTIAFAILHVPALHREVSSALHDSPTLPAMSEQPIV